MEKGARYLVANSLPFHMQRIVYNLISSLKKGIYTFAGSF